MLYKHAFSPTRIIDVIKISKKTLFPNGYLAPPPVDPTAEEQAEIREHLVRKIGESIPCMSLYCTPASSEILSYVYRVAFAGSSGPKVQRRSDKRHLGASFIGCMQRPSCSIHFGRCACTNRARVGKPYRCESRGAVYINCGE